MGEAMVENRAVGCARPEGAASEAEASRKVREMFTRIAPRYDFLNHVLSLEMDRLWRARTARILRPILGKEDARILDLCCGTGDLSFALQRQAKGRVWGADFAHSMLVRAKQKGQLEAGPMPATWRIPFVEADALSMPFADHSFDLVTTAFGFRNLANYQTALREIFRLLKPGGTVAILEFTEPAPGWFADLYQWYFRKVLPRLGGLISGDRAAYAYLPSSVSRFLRSEELTDLIERTGFEDTRALLWTGGTVALHTAVKRT
jgi:demethylmenaquinone methyltransferase/2-methoxy-6-polyprenyl-1,4-benzoquinol methylase